MLKNLFIQYMREMEGVGGRKVSKFAPRSFLQIELLSIQLHLCQEIGGQEVVNMK